MVILFKWNETEEEVMNKFRPIPSEKIFEIFKGWLDQLTREEIEALHWYSNEGYKDINFQLREGKEDFFIKNIKGALDKFILPVSLPVYRSEYREEISCEEFLDLFSKEEGEEEGFLEEIITPYYNFISTSFSESKAWNYMEENLRKKNLGTLYLFMKAVVPKGIKCGYIAPHIAYLGEVEGEILLTHGLVFKFGKVVEKDENIVVVEGNYFDIETYGKILLERGVKI